MQITAVTKGKKANELLEVYVDNQYSFSIKEEDYVSLGLYAKIDISQDEIDQIKITINKRYAKNAAIKYLTLKLRTVKDVSTKLEAEGYDQNTIEATVSELKSMGYLNDLMYAQKYIFDRSKLKPKSRKMLIFELKNKGVQDEIVECVMNEYVPDDKAVAESLLRKKFGKYDLNDDTVFKRAYSFLHHRGFTHDIIITLLKDFRK